MENSSFQVDKPNRLTAKQRRDLKKKQKRGQQTTDGAENVVGDNTGSTTKTADDSDNELQETKVKQLPHNFYSGMFLVFTNHRSERNFEG